MNWTQDTPKEVGWYWYKYEDDQRILKLELNHDQLMYRVFSFETRTEVYCYLPMKGWWYGPLEAPPGPDPQRQAEVSLSDLRPLEGNVGPNRGYLEQPEGSLPGSFRSHLYDPYGEDLDD